MAFVLKFSCVAGFMDLLFLQSRKRHLFSRVVRFRRPARHVDGMLVTSSLGPSCCGGMCMVFNLTNLAASIRRTLQGRAAT